MREPQTGVGAHALWRGVNETIAASARLAHEQVAAFVCECGSYACVERIETTLEEYERVHSDGTRFLVVPGHEPDAPAPAAADEPVARELAFLRVLPG